MTPLPSWRDSLMSVFMGGHTGGGQNTICHISSTLSCSIPIVNMIRFDAKGKGLGMSGRRDVRDLPTLWPRFTLSKNDIRDVGCTADFLTADALILLTLSQHPLSASYLISSKRLLSENIAHVGYFAVFLFVFVFVVVCKSFFYK